MLKYKQISEEIISDIKAGKLVEDMKLPSEKTLSAQYNVSINTIRKALSNLIYLGYVISRQGSGYYINKLKNFESLKLKSLLSAHLNDNVSSEVLDFQIIQADSEQAIKLNVELNSAIYYIKRIRYINGNPHQIENTYVPVQLFPTLNKKVFEGSFYSFIENETNLVIKRAIKDISAINIDKDTALLFKREENDAVLTIENYGYLSDGTQFEYSYNIHNDKQFSINVNSV